MNNAVQMMIKFFQQMKYLRLKNYVTGEEKLVATKTFVDLRDGPEDGIFIVTTEDKKEYLIDNNEVILDMMKLSGFVETSEGTMINPRRIKSLNKNRLTVTLENDEELLVETARWDKVVAAYHDYKK